MNRELPEKPQVGWGILNPDSHLAPETEALVAKLRELPEGQRDFLLAHCIHRQLYAVEGLEDGQEPSGSDMALASSAVTNVWLDALGYN